MDCSAAIKELIDLVNRIKDTLNETRQPGPVISKVLTKEIFTTVSLMHDLCSSIYIPHAPDTAAKLKLLQIELNRIVTRRESMARQWTRWILGYLKSFVISDRTNDELARIHVDIQDCHKDLEAKRKSRMDMLERINAKLEDRIAKAEKNDALAEGLVHIPGENSYNASQLLRDCEQFLKDDNISSLARRYLNLKVKLLRSSVPNDWRTAGMKTQSTLARSSFDVDTHGLVMEEDWVNKAGTAGGGGPSPVRTDHDVTSRAPVVVDEDADDRVLELLRLSYALQGGCEKSHRQAIPFIQRLIKSLEQFDMFEEAADLGEWMVDIHLGLVMVGDNELRSSLVTSRIQSVHFLVAAGRGDQAVDAAKANVKMCREEVEVMPKQWLPKLADALRSQGVALHHAGNHDEEIEALVESVNLHGQHAECDDGPTSFHSFDYKSLHRSPSLAIALDNLAKQLYNWSKYLVAIDASKASLDINLKLAEDDPDQYHPKVAASYEGLSSSLIALKRYEDAVSALEQSTEIYFQLAKKQPAAFLKEFARMSKKLSDQLCKLDRHEDALDVLESSICLHKESSAVDVADVLKDWATCLVIKSSILSLLSRHDEALTAALESVKIYRKVNKNTLSSVAANLAFSLDLFSWTLYKSGHDAAALSNLDEAFELLSSRKDEVKPDRYKLVLGACLKTKASCLYQLDRDTEAAQAETEASEMASTLWPKDLDMEPDVYVMDEYPFYVSQGLYKIDIPRIRNTPREVYAEMSRNDWGFKTVMGNRSETTVGHGGGESDGMVFDRSLSPW